MKTDVKMDVKLDMELDMKISHGRVRRSGRNAREKTTSSSQHRRGPLPASHDPVTVANRRQPDMKHRRATTGKLRSFRFAPLTDHEPPAGPQPVDRIPDRTVRVCLDQIYSGSVILENKSAADIITWREYEALRNEMRREFRAQDEVLNGKIDEISQKLDATHVTVTTMQDQMTDVQRNLADLRLAVENLTAQQQQDDDEDPELQDDAHNARDAPRGNRPRGWAPLGRNGRGQDEEDGLDRKIKLASSEFDGYALRWWDAFVRNRDEDGEHPIRTWRAMKEAMTSRFVPTNYLRNIYDKLTLLRQGVKTVDEYYMEMEMLMQRGRVRESLEMTMQRFLNGLNWLTKQKSKVELQEVGVSHPRHHLRAGAFDALHLTLLRLDDDDTDGEDAYPSNARTIVVSQRALNVLPSASTQRCNLFQTKALVGPDKACKVIIDGGSCRNLASKELCTKLKLKYLPHPHPYYIQWLSDNGEMKEFGDVFPDEVPAGLPPSRDTLGKARDKATFQYYLSSPNDGQTEVVNRTLSQLLRSMIKKNLKKWEECLPHVEFAYNRAVHSTTELCPFEVVYGFKPITPLDLLPLPIHERVNMEASKRADFVRKIHVKTKELIEKKGKSNAARMNKKRKEMLFKPGDMVWVHFRFPKLRKSKLKPRGAGPYKVLAKINDNAYSIDIPVDEFGVSNSFNVADLTPYEGEDLGASGSTPFEGGGMMRTSLLHHYLRH
ncbi:hypothetical protein QYE76_016379 [Lolium multiflorum]|uniref:Uncharacterized protein n=1 Tax=Lolium multiflorum TaxID=4521 RepID=A0AAD8PLT8_LOLMU|nr:hypothetical protein QYE76_016379 [Lolium multiflorum]